MPPAWDLAYNPGMCPNQESNWQPFRPVLNPLSHTGQGSFILNVLVFQWTTIILCTNFFMDKVLANFTIINNV